MHLIYFLLGFITAVFLFMLAADFTLDRIVEKQKNAALKQAKNYRIL